ncbi:putative Polynucleotidyl transferase [Hibiscus syriacus]|uniref:Polynucleotidyl transferase n=1 Tax=Hibiscus syriacus TaxID=106335 RepID=A0A6A2WLQ0_HIBSY|nr:putative Polynucleotidyl transferase [Hibiscus syriacus]
MLEFLISKFEFDDASSSTPKYLTLNHVPLNPNTLREAGTDPDSRSIILRRVWVNKRSEEAIFVSTDSIRLTRSVKFEVFDKDTILLHGVLEFNSYTKGSRESGQKWSMDCKNVMAKQILRHDSDSPTVEVHVAGSFMGSPIILTQILRPSLRMKQMEAISMPDSIPEYEHPWVKCFEDEDGKELSLFNAGVKVGLGIGFSICVGIGISLGLLVRTFQGTTIPNFQRRF